VNKILCVGSILLLAIVAFLSVSFAEPDEHNETLPFQSFMEEMQPLVDWSVLQVPVLVPRLTLNFVSGQEELERRLLGVFASSESA